MNDPTYLKGLNEAQKRAVLHEVGPLLIVAGAGAGKTRTITHRIAHLIQSGVNPYSILAVTFTNKAAGEMRERVQKLLGSSAQPLVTTFHGLGARLLREFAGEAGIPRSFSIWDRDDSMRVLKRILKEESLQPRSVLSAISRAKGEGTREDYTTAASSYYEKAVAEAWREYDIELQKEGALDFSDLLQKTLVLLSSRQDVLDRLNKRWHHLTIDEYQDTNRAQFEIARLLAGERRNICAVGDLDQNVYSWNGADISNLLSFEKKFPGTTTILLEQNYRSTQTILTAANGVIEKNINRIPKRLFTENPTGEAIQLFCGETEHHEAHFIAREARALLGSGIKPSEVAVLFRQNFQSRALEEAFIAEGVPYRVLGVRFFDRAEVKDLLSYLRAAQNPRARSDFTRASGAPSRGIGAQTLEKYFRERIEALAPAAQRKVSGFLSILVKIRTAIATTKASDAVRLALTESGLETALLGSDEDKDRLNNVFELVAHATRYDELPPGEGIIRLLEDAALMGEQDALETRKEAVSLMTMHAAKGLEFDAVFVTGLEQGLFPSDRDDGDRDAEEERRLFYVALTRARKHLYLTLAGSRARYGTRDHASPSIFLDDIDQRLISYNDGHQAVESIIYA